MSDNKVLVYKEDCTSGTGFTGPNGLTGYTGSRTDAVLEYNLASLKYNKYKSYISTVNYSFAIDTTTMIMFSILEFCQPNTQHNHIKELLQIAEI